jgi:hypothetical protein
MTEETYLIIRTLSGNIIGTRLPGQYNDSEVILKNVMDIIQEEDNGAIFYSMLPHFILYENEPVTFNSRYILEQSVPTDSLVQMYKKSFDKYILNFKENNKETTKHDMTNVKFDRGRLN